MTDRTAPEETTPTVAASGERSVGVGRDINNSNIFIGDPSGKIGLPAGPEARPLHQLRAAVGDFVGRKPDDYPDAQVFINLQGITAEPVGGSSGRT